MDFLDEIIAEQRMLNSGTVIETHMPEAPRPPRIASVSEQIQNELTKIQNVVQSITLDNQRAKHLLQSLQHITRIELGL